MARLRQKSIRRVPLNHEAVCAKEASQDLDEILDYFLTFNIKAGKRFVHLTANVRI